MEKNVLDKLKETLVWKKKINANNGYQQRCSFSCVAAC